jgi:diguanylate cyclase (GGDEF)-like protein
VRAGFIVSTRSNHVRALLSSAWMVHVLNEHQLSSVLSEFARTLITDFPIQGILDHLVERIVDVLPISAAGVTLISEGAAPRYVAASDESALRYEQLQTELGEGPCLSAYTSGDAVATADLRADASFPRFGPAAVDAGLAAVFTFPLRHGDTRLGALDLYRDTPGALSQEAMDAAQTLADVAAAYLLNAEARDEARIASERFHHSSLHDPLTGLPNRLLLHGRLEHAAQRARRSHTHAAVLFIDLDRFKRVNDRHGHHVGDELLVAVAHRLSLLVRSGDTLARFSGDEFVFLCEDLRCAADAEILAQRVVDAFAMPFELDGTDRPLFLTASVGVAFAGPGEDISQQLVVEADLAMYQTKRSGSSGHRVLDLREALRSADDTSLEHELRGALARDELDIAYQPIVRTTDSQVVGVEALLRWTHAERGPVSPLWVVGIAERTTLIDDVGAWILARSCRDHGHWMHTHPGVALDLAVNVSARQLTSPGFLASVTGTLERTGTDPSTVVLEMTESILIEDTDRAMTVLCDLQALGLRLALDDFGTGFSSLEYLRRLPIHILKIDRAFVADIGATRAGWTIVDAVTQIAHVLGLSVVAEGVEDRDEHEAIRTIGCELAQGFFYAQPMSAEAIDTLLGTTATSAPRLFPASIT